MSVMGDAIMKDEILKLIYEGHQHSIEISQLSQYSYNSIISLAEEMQERGHIIITKASDGNGAFYIIKPNGNTFLKQIRM